MAAQNLARYLTVLLVFFFESRAAAGGPLFSQDILRGRDSAVGFFDQISMQNLQHAQSLYSDLAQCAKSPGPEGQSVQDTLGFLKMQFRAIDGRPFNLEQIVHDRVPVSVIPPWLIGVVTHFLDLAHSKHKVDCLKLAGHYRFRHGSAFFDIGYAQILRIANDARFYYLMKTLMPLYSVSGEALVTAVYEIGANSVLPALGSSYSFLRQAWVKPFVLNLLTHPHVKRALVEAFSMDHATFIDALAKTYEIISPFRLQVPGRFNDNSTYPFVDYAAHRIFSNPKVQNCMTKISAQLTPEDVLGLKTQSPQDAHDFLLRRYSEICDGAVSKEDILAILAIEDRQKMWMLPLSVVRVMNSQWAERNRFPAEGTLLKNTSPQELESEYLRWRGVERLTFVQVSALADRRFNHVSCPHFALCELKRRYPQSPKEVRGMVFLAGLAYQMFDAAAAVEMASQAAAVSEILLRETRVDLDLWGQALWERSHCP